MVSTIKSNLGPYKTHGHDGIPVIVLRNVLPTWLLFSLNYITIVSLPLRLLLIGNPHLFLQSLRTLLNHPTLPTISLVAFSLFGVVGGNS